MSLLACQHSYACLSREEGLPLAYSWLAGSSAFMPPCSLKAKTFLMCYPRVAISSILRHPYVPPLLSSIKFAELLAMQVWWGHQKL